MDKCSWLSLGRNTVGRQMMREGCGERLFDSGPRGPIIVPVTSGGGWCNWWLVGMMASPVLPPGHYSNAVLGFLTNDNGASRLLGTCSTYARGRVCGSVLIVGSSMMNIERR